MCVCVRATAVDTICISFHFRLCRRCVRSSRPRSAKHTYPPTGKNVYSFVLWVSTYVHRTLLLFFFSTLLSSDSQFFGVDFLCISIFVCVFFLLWRRAPAIILLPLLPCCAAIDICTDLPSFVVRAPMSNVNLYSRQLCVYKNVNLCVWVPYLPYHLIRYKSINKVYLRAKFEECARLLKRSTKNRKRKKIIKTNFESRSYALFSTTHIRFVSAVCYATKPVKR